MRGSEVGGGGESVSPKIAGAVEGVRFGVEAEAAMSAQSLTCEVDVGAEAGAATEPSAVPQDGVKIEAQTRKVSFFL